MNRNDFQIPKAFLSSRSEGSLSFYPYEISFGGEKLPSQFLHFDYAASTPIHRSVFEAMEPWLWAYFGNPASNFHAMGRLAHHAVQQARANAAAAVGAAFDDVILTSSATESNNLLLRGLVQHRHRTRTHMVIAQTEHASIATTARVLEKNYASSLGIRSITLPVDCNGQIDLNEAERVISGETLCVCAMDVNNETGIAQNGLRELIAIAHRHGAPVHVDAVQGFARGEFLTKNLEWDSLTLSSGKIYGPRGAALLALRKIHCPCVLEPQITGGGHEFGMRSSTINVAGVVGFAKAIELQENCRADRNQHYAKVEQEFVSQFIKHTPQARIVGNGAPRVPGIASFIVDGVNPIKLMENAGRIALGVGSACKSLSANASHVLLAMGYPADEALASFRVSVGAPSTETEAHDAALLLAGTIARMR